MKIIAYLKRRDTELNIRQRLLRSFLAALAVVVLLHALYAQTAYNRWELNVDRIEQEHQVWLGSDQGKRCSSLMDQLNRKIAGICGSSVNMPKHACEISATEINEIESEVNAISCPLVIEKSRNDVQVMWQHQQARESFMVYYVKSLPHASAIDPE